MTLYFTFCSTLKAATLVKALRGAEWTVAWIIDVTADVAALGFLVLIVATTVARLPPVSTAQGIEPRISALIGCFATATLIAVPRVETLPQIQLAADLITIVGFTLCIWCLWWLGRSFSITAQARRLVTAGPYQIVRHPLYACEAIVLLGIVLSNPTWATIAIGAIALAFQYRRIVNEEKVLRAAFPEYSAYARTTRMLIPSLSSLLGAVIAPHTNPRSRSAGPAPMMLQRTVDHASFANVGAGTRNHLIVIAATALFGLIDLLWLPRSWVRVESSNLIDLTTAAAVISALYVAGWTVTARLRSDQSRFASGLRRGGEAIKKLAVALALFIPFLFASCLFMYLATATTGALMDARFSGIDAVLGFDWLATVNAANSSPIAASILMFCYHAVGPLMVGVFVLLAFSSDADALLEFNALLAISTIFTGALMAAFPAAGAYAFYAPPRDLFSNFTGAGGLDHLQTLAALRSGAPFSFHVTETIGLVSFPSFHAALGILIVYAVRNIRLLFVVVLTTNAVMIVATLPEGGHHLIDLIAGVAVGVLSIVAVRMSNYERRKADSVPRSAVGSEVGR
ncbi:phosphatase PAP2 family protein [Mesorhizobium sp.]|uniref:phosphatase PAP2 family protein n=1 Tax=Mesorhizobium sp. TaxID=1871066 RepID=UPI0025F7E2EC|nr:phosphatase PAP2 family protein [Mesorhizobium sp.]